MLEQRPAGLLNRSQVWPWRIGSSSAFIIGLTLWLGVPLNRPAEAAGPTDELLRYLPRETNALVLMDAKSLLTSELAVKEGWAKKRELSYAGRPILVPPEATAVAIAAQLDPTDNLARVWELAVMSLSEPIAMRSIARAEGGYADTLGGVSAAWTPSNAYFVSLDQQRLGAVWPANRQLAARWVEFGRTNQAVALSEYLRTAGAQLGPQTQLVMALDAVDAVQPHRVRERLAQFSSMAGQQDKLEAFAQLIGGIRGVTLTLSVTNQVRGKIRVDFSQPASVLGTIAKPLFLEALDLFDAHLSDLETWTARPDGYSLVLEGTLSTVGVRRVASILEIPSTKFSDLKDVEPAKPDSTDFVQASQRYFKSITTLITDLQDTLKDKRDNHAVWMERYAGKIDSLPILNVDEELLAWGARVAESFRGMGLAKRTSGIRQGVRKSSVYGNYVYASDGYYNTSRSTTSVKNQIETEEQAQATLIRFQGWKEIDDATAEIRRGMTKKYNTEF